MKTTHNKYESGSVLTLTGLNSDFDSTVRVIIVGCVASSRYTCAEVGVIGEGDYEIREQ